MLLEISIKNFAIIEEISLNFEKGMTVLTGETGAGKSIIIDAMNMMLGSRATTDVIRHGAPKAEIEGLFLCPAYCRNDINSLILEKLPYKATAKYVPYLHRHRHIHIQTEIGR